jgi:hypothetical protein
LVGFIYRKHWSTGTLRIASIWIIASGLVNTVGTQSDYLYKYAWQTGKFWVALQMLSFVAKPLMAFAFSMAAVRRALW